MEGISINDEKKNYFIYNCIMLGNEWKCCCLCGRKF